MKTHYCHICKKPIRSFTHLKTHKEIEWNSPETRYAYICFNVPKIKDKETLSDLYINKKYSLPMLSTFYDGLDYKSIRFMLTYYKIPVRGISESLKDPIIRKRIDESNIKTFGAKNPLSKGTLPYLKRNQTVKDRYGVENVFQILDEFIDEYKGRHKKSKISYLNKIVKEALDKLNIKYVSEYKISYIREKDFKKCYKFYDFYIPSKNLLIEVNGDYWHANPAIFKEDAIFYFPKTVMKAKDIWALDEYKKNLAIVNKYNIKYIWESSLKKKSKEEIDEIVKNCIN